MVNLKLPKPEKIKNDILIEDYFYPDYYEDHSLDSDYFNDKHQPIMRTHVPIYPKRAYEFIKNIREECQKEYEEWLSKKPSFVEIDLFF